MMKVLIIEDDVSIAELERDYLQVNGFECEIACDGEIGLRRALNEDFSLVIIDIMLPGRDGFSICTELRKVKDVPIIFLSAKSEDIDKVRGLGLGADDYMTKPFSPSELVARVKTHIERYKRLVNTNVEKKSSVISVRGLKIDRDARRVYVNDVEVIMPVKEFEVLLFLAENPNIVFSKERLFDRLWGMDAMGDVSTVTVHIQRIRDKIESDKEQPKYIETIWGAGYRFKL
ncbi:MAG: response regulator transcription factor [Oscillospiraceae bacterium]